MRAFAFLLALFCAGRAEAATFYVSLLGSDANSCATATSTTQSNQKLTIAAAVACASAGDTVYIHGGTYTGANNVIDSQTRPVNSGTSFVNAITIAGYPSESVILQPPNNVSGIRLTTGAPHHLIFQDFVIDMINSSSSADADGVYFASAHHNRLQRLEIKNSYQNGVHFGVNTPFNEVLNCKVHDNRYPSYPPNTPAPHGLYVTASDNLFEGNEVYNNQGYGFHIYNNNGSHDDPSRNVLRNNSVHNNGKFGTQSYGIVIAWGSDNRVYNNVIYGNRGGIQVYTDSTNTGIFNNSIYANTGEGIALQYYAGGQIVRNNIVYGNGAGIVDYGGASTPLIDHNLTTDPGFVNAAGGDFSLRPGSAAHDAGIAIPAVTNDFTYRPRPQDAGYDIGAYETGGTAGPLTRAPTNVGVVRR